MDHPHPSPPPASPNAQAGSFGRLRDFDANESDRAYSMVMHILAAVAVWTFVPFFVIPILWLIKKDDSPFIDDHGRELTNLFLTDLLISVLAIVSFGFLLPLALIWNIFITVAAIRGAMASKDQEYFRYPMTFRFV